MNGLPRPEVGLAHVYREFATLEAAGNCAIYERLCLDIAADAEVLALLETLPMPKRQPNLLLAASRWHGAPLSYPDYPMWLKRHWEPVSQTMLTRRTQTNEPARMDTLLPVLRRLPQPLALLEVGASAGLCLYPRGDTVEVAWRAGLDLNPLSVFDEADMRWLECLVWPSQPHRLARLRETVEVARHDPPAVHRGDLLTDLEPVVAQAPKDATLVVFHTAVLAYVDRPGRAAFAARMRRLAETGAGHWLSNEAPGVMHDIEAPPGHIVLALDDRPVAFTAPHGQSFQWIDPAGAPA